MFGSVWKDENQHERQREGWKWTWVSRRHFSTTTDSWSFFKLEYSSSSFLFFQRARRFWNQTATWRGSSPNSDARRSFLSDSNLCSLPKLVSKRWTCAAVSFLFFATASASDPLFFLRRRLRFASPKLLSVTKTKLPLHGEHQKLKKRKEKKIEFWVKLKEEVETLLLGNHLDV